MERRGLFQKIFGAPKNVEVPKGASRFETLTAYQPQFRAFGNCAYESELVRAAIDARARNISKLSINFQGGARPSLVSNLRKGPNTWQTWGQFLYRLSTILDVENTAFIVPVFNDYGDVTGIFPVLPRYCTMVEYKGKTYLRYEFWDGQKACIEWEKCGVMTRFQYKDDILGENNEALRPTLELVNIQNQGIREGVKNSATIRFYAQMDNFVDPEDLEKEQTRFTDYSLKSENQRGFLLFPSQYKNITRAETKPFVADAAQIELIQTNVYNYFGVNKDVLQNKAFGDAWSAFYEGAIEPFAIQLSDVLTKMLFTLRERAAGNLVIATSNRLQYMSNADKLSVAQAMADRGLMTRNEIREIFNLAPLPSEIGDTLPVRGEYHNVGEEENASQN